MHEEPISGHVTVNGVRIHYLDWGGQGTPIVILHATGFLGRVYGPMAQDLTAIGHVYAVDARGHGDSDRPPGDDCDWSLVVSDFIAFLDRMEMRGIIAIGHSMGGGIAAAAAAERPELFSRVIFLDPAMTRPSPAPSAANQRPGIANAHRRRRVFDSVQAAYDNYSAKEPFNTWRIDILRDYCEHGTRPTSDGKRELKCHPEIEAGFFNKAREFDGLTPALSLKLPILLLLPEDTYLPAAATRAEIGKLSNATVIEIPGGHLVPMEYPDIVTRAIIDWLSNH